MLQHINTDTLNRIEVDDSPTVQKVLCCLQISPKTLNLILLTLQNFAVGGTADALICKTSLRNSRTIDWPSDVLDSWDSRFVRFLNNRTSIFLFRDI